MKVRTRSSYSMSPYGKMRDRIAKAEERKASLKKKKDDDYYTWLITGVK